MKAALALILLAACGGSSAPVAPQSPQPPPATPVTPEAPAMPTTQTAQPQELTFPDEAFRATQPAPGPVHAFKLPVMKPFALPNGIEVYLVEQHDLPIVSMDLNFDGGSVTDPKAKDGLAGVCMAMLTEGTQQLDKIQYSEALADVASQINAYATDDSQGLGLATLTKHLDATFALFADTLRAPGWRPADFDRMIKRRVEALKQARGNPTQIPSRVMGPVLYGPAHPLGTVTTQASLEAITLDDCKHFAATWLQPGHARLFVVGDLTKEQIEQLFAKSTLAAWKGTAPKPPALPAPKTMAGRIFFVNVPTAAQSTVMFLEMGPKRTAADYFSNTIMSQVFGGSFTSRLNMNLREDKGYSYGARGGLSYGKTFGAITATAPVQADSTYQALLEIHRELTSLASGTQPVSSEELEREKLNATLALPGRFATSQAALGQYRSLVYYGLPLDYFNSYVDHVNKVTAAEVKQSAESHLKPAQGVYLVVGDGNAKMIVDDPAQPKDKRRVPYMKNGTQLTLREALVDLAAHGDVGPGGLVELDVDGHPMR
ncbi:MAG TPA: pitrilysin family protein [Kofleriaceae bacterium]